MIDDDVGWCSDGRSLTFRSLLRVHVQDPLLHPHPAARHRLHLNQEQTQVHHSGSQSAHILPEASVPTDSRVLCVGVRETYSREVGAPVIQEQLRRFRSSVTSTSPRLTVTLTRRSADAKQTQFCLRSVEKKSDNLLGLCN